jgi:hypothetical protein
VSIKHFEPYTQKWSSWAWWHMPVIQALGRLRQEDHEFKDSLGCIARLCLIKRSRREILCYMGFFFLSNTEILTRSLTLARQVLYQLSHVPAHMGFVFITVKIMHETYYFL